MDATADSLCTFHDYKPKQLSLYDEVVDGFSKPNKSLPPKFFYDERGSQLFDQICQQPEYYLPDVERQLLLQHCNDIANLIGRERVVIEPGAGSLAKIRLLLDALSPSAYVPMDISHRYLRQACQSLSKDFPWLDIHGTCVDFTHSMPLPEIIPDNPRLIFFPGSSLGNFHHQEAREFLQLIHDTLGPDGMLLIGVDTKKPKHILDSAYNDEAGVTAKFNLNLIHRIRRELGAACLPEKFRHHAFYNEAKGRIEMHLISTDHQNVEIEDHQFVFEKGESLHTECSYKYTPSEFLSLAESAELAPVKHWLAKDDLFGLYLLRRN